MIKIDEEYFLTNDSNQWVLNYEKEREINKDTGKPTVSTNKWYCGNLNLALVRYLNESVKFSNSVLKLQSLTILAVERITELLEKHGEIKIKK